MTTKTADTIKTQQVQLPGRSDSAHATGNKRNPSTTPSRHQRCLKTIEDVLDSVGETDAKTDPHRLLSDVCNNLAASGLYKGIWGRLFRSSPTDVFSAAGEYGTVLPTASDAEENVFLAPCIHQALEANALVILPEAKSNCRSCPLISECGGTTRVILGLYNRQVIHGVLSIGLLNSSRLASAEMTALRGMASSVAAKLNEIEDYRRLREADVRSSELYRTIFENTGTIMWIVDSQGKVSLVNSRFEHVTGYHRDEIEGIMDWETLFPPEDIPAMRPIRSRRLAADPETPEQYYARLVTRNGTIIPVLKTSTLIPNSKSVLSSLMDVSQEIRALDAQREAEARAQQSQRLASVGQMAAGIAHEVNNPVTGIIGFADLLLQQELSEDALHYASVVKEAGQRVASIIEQLLAFARWRTPTRQPVDLSLMIEDTIRLRQPNLKESNVAVVLGLCRCLPPVLADPGQLEQVLLNIIVNAETEMRLTRGSGTLTISTRRRGDTAVIKIEDTGPGIPEGNLDRIFDPFFTTRDVGQGTGLGLSICHGIVTEHGGRIRARNNPKGGATFTVRLPLAGELPAQPVSATV